VRGWGRPKTESDKTREFGNKALTLEAIRDRVSGGGSVSWSLEETSHQKESNRLGRNG
jgi:hypothetical protein